MSKHTINVDPAEIEKFGALASKWWDPHSEFKPLHAINPLRLGWLLEHTGTSLAGQVGVDVGCGGGILTEALAKQGAQVTGIDLAEASLKVARLHSLESQLNINYQYISAEDYAAQHAGQADFVTCMEMLEHVPNPASVIQACADMVKPGGWVFFSTINRNATAFLQAIVAAEYLLKLVPTGTHFYENLIKPHELARSARQAQLEVMDLRGLGYNPLTQHYSLSTNTNVNYLMATRKVVL